jgi:TPP-dependent pyruvate/acetoin dehydrogenase alpha subunit
MRSMTVDGQDVEAVHRTATRALRHARTGKGPVFLLAETFRLVGHYVGDPQVYRPKGEAAELRETQDPLEKLRPKLGLADEELEAIDAEVVHMLDGAVEFARNATEHRPEDALEGVYA